MKFKFILVLTLVLNISTPIASSQTANVLNFSASESFNLTFPEGSYYSSGRQVPFKKGDRPSAAYLNSEMEHICRENYSSAILSVKRADGSLSNHKLLSATSALKTKWIIASNGKNSFFVNAACKQWGIFSIPNSDGYQFNLKVKSIDSRADKLPSSPWYSKNYLYDNQWKVIYFNNVGEAETEALIRSKWLPRAELPAMPAIRVLSANDDDPFFRLTSLEISGGQFTSTPTGGWNKWTVQFTDYFSLPPFTPEGTLIRIPGRRMYTAENVGTFTWALKVHKDEIPAPSFEIGVTQTGYRYSSQVGRFVIPPVGESVQLVDVHRTPEGAKIGD